LGSKQKDDMIMKGVEGFKLQIKNKKNFEEQFNTKVDPFKVTRMNQQK